MIRNELIGPIDEISYTPKNDRERAQETCFKAFDAWGRRQTELVERALELDAECVDALVLKAERTRAPEEALEPWSSTKERWPREKNFSTQRRFRILRVISGRTTRPVLI